MSQSKLDKLHELANQIGSRPPPAITGEWFPIQVRPDLFREEAFTVGVGFRNGTNRTHYLLIDRYEKLECLYGNQFDQDDFGFLMKALEYSLSHHRHDELNQIPLPSLNVRLGPPRYASGDSPEQIVDDLYNQMVVLLPDESLPKAKSSFESMDNNEVQAAVTREIKRIAGIDAEKVLVDGGIIQAQDDQKTYFLDIPIQTKTQLAGIVSAWYKTWSSIQNNLFNAMVDLDCAAGIKKKAKGMFVLRPFSSKEISESEQLKIDNQLDKMDWKMKRSNTFMEVMDTPEALAGSVLAWAKI